MKSTVLLTMALVGLVACAPGPNDEATPRLAVILAIDGLSTEQLVRHRDCLSEGGFQRLLNGGTWMTQGRYAHSTTFTAAGHGTIATGASPRTHGLVANDWLDRTTGESVYCVEDPAHVVLDEPARDGAGTSPANMLVPAFGDLLRQAQDGRGRTLAVSIKDRGAITGAGREGKAFWYSTGTGRFVTSDFYYDAYPDWWTDHYADRPQDAWFGQEVVVDVCGEQTWFDVHGASLEGLAEGDRRLDPQMRIGGDDEGPGRATWRGVRETPLGDEATLDFVRLAMEGEGLGITPGVTDHLFMSLSAHDYVNHAYGPDSPHSTAQLVGLDAALQDFFEWLDETVSEDRWVLALTADHGFPSAPEAAIARGEGGGRLDPRGLGAIADAAIDGAHGDGDWVLGWSTPTFVVDLELARERDLPVDVVLGTAKAALEAQPGVREVFTRSELASGHTGGEFGDAVLDAWRADRSGDLFVIQDPYWYLLRDPDGLAATHGSPYEYDRGVPLVFYGPGFEARESEEPAHVRDIVPTLLRHLGAAVPVHVDGAPLDLGRRTASR